MNAAASDPLLPPRPWRKTVAATQGIVLTVAAADVLPPGLVRAALLVALALLAESFGRDVWWLARHRPGALSSVAMVVQPATLRLAETDTGRRGRSGAPPAGPTRRR